MTDHKERFLEAEEQATSLASQMRELKSKIDAHTEATSSLTETRKSVTALLGEVAEMTQGMPSVISKLSEIGTPTILDSIETSRAETSNNIVRVFEKASRLLWIAIALNAVSLIGLVFLIILVLLRMR
ncbi:MAG: hypothetical protein FJ010_09350 [Chloroflexi bacterium]|nr:hypothetical protein [Chloroflexota bacterium]